MSIALPSSWAVSEIGSLCDLKNGRAFKSTEWSSEGLPIVRIQNLNNPNAAFNRYSGVYEDKYYLKGGELLFAWSGTPGTSFGAHVWRGGEALLNQHIFRVDFDDSFLDRRLFRHAINQKLNDLIGKAHGGAGLQHVTKGKFEATRIVVPPRNEQRRIADKLDTILNRVDALNDHLSRITPLLKRFRQSVLAAAASGRLTEDWRSIASPYKTASLSELAEARLGKMLDKGKNTGEWVQYLRNVNVRWLVFDLDDLLEMKIEQSELENLSIKNGDVLICEGGEPGRCAVWKGGETNLVFQKALHRVRVDRSKLLPDWLAINLKHQADSSELDKLFTGSTIKHLTGSSLAKLVIPMPSVEEQAEIVRRVEILFAYADRLEARLQTARTAADRLTPALLAKAFRGELVLQDPNDEPATELLRRLREARTAEAPAKKPRGRKVVDA